MNPLQQVTPGAAGIEIFSTDARWLRWVGGAGLLCCGVAGLRETRTPDLSGVAVPGGQKLVILGIFVAMSIFLVVRSFARVELTPTGVRLQWLRICEFSWAEITRIEFRPNWGDIIIHVNDERIRLGAEYSRYLALRWYLFQCVTKHCQNALVIGSANVQEG
jgi:hypothetical protein